MNNLKIAYDGRVTAWNTNLTSPKASKAPKAPPSEEWELFTALPREGKEEFLTSYLGSSHVINSHATPKPRTRAARGSKGITSYGRSLIRCGAQYLQDRYGVKHLSFFTGTLPSEALAAYTPESWSEVLRRFLQSLRYHLEKGGLCSQIVGCVEIQSRRLASSPGLVPVHLHIVFQGRQIGSSWAYHPDFYQELWEVAVTSVWACTQGFQSSCSTESIRSSAVSYLGKYMSKGGDVLKSIEPDMLPSAWYTISTKLKEFVKNAVFKVSGQTAHDLYEYLYLGDKMHWCRSVMSEYTEQGTCYLLAWIGQIRERDEYWMIVDTMRETLYTLAKENLTGVL